MFRLFFVQFYLYMFLSILYIPTYILSYAYGRKDRELFFRERINVLIRFALWLSFVQVHTYNNVFLSKSTIYVSNYSSKIDPLLFLALLGPEIILITKPFGTLPFIVSLWCKQMGAIDVIVDDEEHTKYPKTNTKHQALHKALKALKKGNSLLFFPERDPITVGGLYTFHTGPIRVSYASNRPIQTITLKNTHRVFSNRLSLERTAQIHFGRCFVPSGKYTEHILFSTDKNVREMIRTKTHELEKDIHPHKH